MTKKQDLQKEILANVTAGITPSALKKKLKKSKSESDLPNTPKSPLLKHSHSLNEIPLLPADELEDKVSVLELRLETKDRELTEKDASIAIYLDQLDNKQKELESLRKQLETTNQKLTETTAELDYSLEIRHQSLKDWDQQQEQIKTLSKELDETIDQASEELVENDNTIANLRTKINQLKSAKENLEKDLKLEQIKKGIRPNPINIVSADNFLQYSFYALLALAILVSITVQEK